MKRQMTKRVLASVLAGTMMFGLAACGSDEKVSEEKTDNDKVVLNVINYHVGTDYAADYYSYLFEEFQKTEEGKNVEFKFEEIPTTDAYNQKIKLLISSGDLPDIVFSVC